MPGTDDIVARLSVVDRFLPVWILAAMTAGIGMGRAVPGIDRWLDRLQVTSGTPLPIFIGLLVMMYLVLARVRYGRLGAVARDRRMLVSSLALYGLLSTIVVLFALQGHAITQRPGDVARVALPSSPTSR